VTPLLPTIEYLEQGGWIMIPLILCSLAMWTLILDRVFTFHRLATPRDLSIPAAIGVLERGSLVEDKDHLTRASSDGLCTRVVKAFLAQRVGHSKLDREVLQHCARCLQPSLNSHLAIIASLAAVVPLLGLLGTVIGMIETFDVISVFGTGNARAMAGGISVALITTQTGLVIAVPGLFLSFLLHRRARRLEIRLQEITTALVRHV
jgi:biopolymer transport protein ExbB